jgi:hypothetical protein
MEGGEAEKVGAREIVYLPCMRQWLQNYRNVGLRHWSQDWGANQAQ